MTRDAFNAVVGMFAGIVIGAVIAGSFVSGKDTAYWTYNTIKRGFAEYNQTTGKWQWKEHVTLTNYVTVTNWVTATNYAALENIVISTNYWVTNWSGHPLMITPNFGGAE